MQLKEIYQPIQKELSDVEQMLRCSLGASKYESILEITNYLLDAKGKRIRPALIIISTKASRRASASQRSLLQLRLKKGAVNIQLTKIAAAIELVHMASLIHDDIIDHASLRHNKPTVNYKWGNDVSIALGDYLYAVAFELISACGNSDILECISSATKGMCEGELVQVCERDNLNLLKQRYLVMVQKKTAALFAASCHVGAMLVNSNRDIQEALKGYGLNFGIAFQIVDDCLDLVSRKKELGKSPGADFKMGELTLPVLHLLSQTKDKNAVLSLLKQPDRQSAFLTLKKRFINSEALLKTKEDIRHYIQKAKESLDAISDSSFKRSLIALVDFLMERVRL